MIATIENDHRATEHILHAVIGVWYRGDRTFYVQRSEQMENYPGAWSLFSIQYDPSELPDSLDLGSVQRVMNLMSAERLHGSPITVRQFLTASVCTKNPIDKIVNMRLYSVDFPSAPDLNPDYYSDAEWMTATDYAKRRGNALCGSCLRMWSDYCRRTGTTTAPLAPSSAKLKRAR